jgi:hypothetical protein
MFADVFRRAVLSDSKSLSLGLAFRLVRSQLTLLRCISQLPPEVAGAATALQ